MTLKKITLASAVALAFLVIPAQAGCDKCSLKSEKTCKGEHKGHHKMGHNSPLLLKLPSPMRMLMKHMDDEKLALTKEQKSKLEAQRNEMMPKMMNLKKEIQTLSQEIKSACKKNAPLSEQKVRIEKLAQLKIQATLIKLTCIAGVKATLNEDQKAYLKELRSTKMKDMTCPSTTCNKNK